MSVEFIKRICSYTSAIRRVSSEHGISPIRQISEIVHLARSPGRIGPGDYYAYRLFDDALPMSEKERFVGWKTESRLDALNESSWHCLGLDKVLMYSLFQSNNILHPQTQAIYLPGRGRVLRGAVSLKGPDELKAWLRIPSNYPFFSKPSASGFARGAYFADRYEASEDRVVFKDGSSAKVDDFEALFSDGERLGYLFQTPIRSDSRLVGSLGPIVSSLRMMVLIDEVEGPLLHRCFWKIPTGANTHDNYDGGRTGNLAAAIDHRSGAITRVISGFGLDVSEVTHHPDSGVALKTLSVPDWEKVLDFTFQAATMLPKLRFQQWDISLSDQGPMALEVNLFGTGGGTASQLLYGKGLLDDTMKAFLARHRL